jgi:hypothetical protein
MWLLAAFKISSGIARNSQAETRLSLQVIEFADQTARCDRSEIRAHLLRRLRPFFIGNAMLNITRDELTFLRWLRTNGGTASLAISAGPDLIQRILSAGYITNERDPIRIETMHFSLTAQGYEVLGLHGHG